MSNLPPLPDSALPNIVPPPTTNIPQMDKPMMTMKKAGEERFTDLKQERDIRPMVAILFFILVSLGVAIFLIGGERIMSTFRGDIRQRASGPIGETSAVENVMERRPTIETKSETTAEISGLICAHGPDKQLAGRIIFFEFDTKIAYERNIPENTSSYTINVPAGKYVAFFKPEGVWPIYAYSQYVTCGLDPNICTEHNVLLLTAERDGEYGEVHLCDPQYEDKTRYSMLLTL